LFNRGNFFGKPGTGALTPVLRGITTYLPKDPYRTLGLPPDADTASIRKAYRKLARKLHPDVNRSSDASDRMSEVNDAYALLADAEKKAAFDASIRVGISNAARATREASVAHVRHQLSVVDLPSPVYTLEFAKAGSELAAGCFDNSIRFLSAATGKQQAETPLEGGALATIRWLGKGRLLAAGVSEKSVSIWRVTNRQVKSQMQRGAEWASQVAIRPDGKQIALGSIHKTLLCIETKGGEQMYIRRRHDDAVSAVAFSDDSKFLATGSLDQRVIVWDSETGHALSVIGPLRAAVSAVRFSPAASVLAVTLIDTGTRLYELRTGNLRTTLWGHERAVEDVTFHPSGKLIATAGRDKTIRLWDTATGTQLEKLGGHSEALKAVSFSADGKYLAAGGLDRVISIWKVRVA
jgi:WD40 repeat protein